MIPELGWPPCRHGRGFRRATCGPLLRVAGNASTLECLPRKSFPQTAFWRSLLLSVEPFYSYRARANLHLARPAPRPVAAREYTHREALRKVLCSPSCSSRAAPVALDTKSSRLTVLCTLSPWCWLLTELSSATAEPTRTPSR